MSRLKHSKDKDDEIYLEEGQELNVFNKDYGKYIEVLVKNGELGIDFKEKFISLEKVYDILREVVWVYNYRFRYLRKRKLHIGDKVTRKWYKNMIFWYCFS